MHMSNLQISVTKYELYTFLYKNYFILCYFSDENQISVYFYTYACLCVSVCVCVCMYKKSYLCLNKSIKLKDFSSFPFESLEKLCNILYIYTLLLVDIYIHTRIYTYSI